jgi:putative transposase
VLLEGGTQSSMDGRGWALDNVLIVRLWRDVMYEQGYLHDYEAGQELHNGLKLYFNFWNIESLHEALKYKVQWEVYLYSPNWLP